MSAVYFFLVSEESSLNQKVEEQTFHIQYDPNCPIIILKYWWTQIPVNYVLSFFPNNDCHTKLQICFSLLFKQKYKG